MRSRTLFLPIRLATALVVSVVAFPTSHALAQSAKAVTPDSAQALIGTWEGKYESDHAPSGAMKLVIANDSVLKASSLSIEMGGAMQSVPVHDLTVTSTDISFIEEAMGMPCQATAVLKSGQMKGAMICGHGQISFTLSKRS
jgi:hypothetical protein